MERFFVSHQREFESFEAKAAWFQSLSLEERMDLLCEFTDLVLEINPRIGRQTGAEPPSDRIRVLSLP
jgi:hypothetical protein